MCALLNYSLCPVAVLLLFPQIHGAHIHSINNNEARLFLEGTKALVVPAICDTIALYADGEIPLTNEYISINSIRNCL